MAMSINYTSEEERLSIMPFLTRNLQEHIVILFIDLYLYNDGDNLNTKTRKNI